MVRDADNGHLYVGGNFLNAGDIEASYIARWDGSEWSALGGGVDNWVYALAWDAENGHLYVGGNFSLAGGVEVNGIARWDGDEWTALGEGVLGGAVRTLVWDADNGHLYAGGSFTLAGGAEARRIARWDGNEWVAIGSGTSWPVHALAWDAANRQLYVGGTFSWAGGQRARIARVETRSHQQPPITITATPEQVELGGQSLLSTSGGSGTGAVSYTIIAGEGSCSISGNVLLGVGVGTCGVTATKDGDSDYRPSSDTVDLTVVPGVFQDRFEEN